MADMRTRSLGLLGPEVSVVGVRAVYAPRGGLGLYVNHGVASFRRVVVQPVVQPR